MTNHAQYKSNIRLEHCSGELTVVVDVDARQNIDGQTLVDRRLNFTLSRINDQIEDALARALRSIETRHNLYPQKRQGKNYLSDRDTLTLIACRSAGMSAVRLARAYRIELCYVRTIFNRKPWI